MKRDLAALARDEHDVLVVGGGIFGAAAVREAAVRGLRAALVEREDFAAVTSWNSLKTVHGGFRHLQDADLVRVRESIAERRRLQHLAPHLVRPLAFLLPTRGVGMLGRPALGAALLAYGLLSLDRNRGLREFRLPGGRLLSRDTVERCVPGYTAPGFSGGALWWDAQMYSSERLVLEFVQAAAEHGAQVANHVEVTGWRIAAGRIAGVRARDAMTGAELEIGARIVINCAGPDAMRLLAMPGGPAWPGPPRCRAANVVLRRALFEDVAVGLRVEDFPLPGARQVLFVAPWRGRSLVGTLHLPLGAHATAELAEAELGALLDGINRAYPPAALGRDDVVVVHTGVQPVAGVDPARGEVRHAKRCILVDHESQHGMPGLLTVLGHKFTVAAGVARRVLDRAEARLGGVHRRSEAPDPGPKLPGGAFERWASLESEAGRMRPAELGEDVLAHLLRTRGARALDVLALAGRDPQLAATITSGSPVCRAELVHALRSEMVLTLADLVARRTELAARGDLDDAALQTSAGLAARELGWDAVRLDRELAACRHRFLTPAAGRAPSRDRT